jgi:parvulin-like peptidyl-prolyl cis-trans isomerase-like protein
MFRIGVTVLIACSLCAAQTTTTPKPGAPAKPQSSSTTQSPTTKSDKDAAQKPATTDKDKATPQEVPPNAPVVTIKNVCEKPDASGKCETVLTKAEFEKLTSAVNPSNGLNPPLPPDAKRQIANRYAQFLALSDEAKKANLDKTPEAQELLHFAAVQALAQLYVNSLQAKSLPTPAEVQKYYDDNHARFEKITVRRILIPANPGPDAKNVTPDQLKQTAQKIYDRAKAGEDFDKLQKEAFTAAGINSAPDSKMVLNPASLPPQQQSVRQLKPGEVSQLFSEVSGSYIYKMESTETTPLASVRPEIEKALQRQKFQETVQKKVDEAKPELNEAYFGAQPKPGTMERD